MLFEIMSPSDMAKRVDFLGPRGPLVLPSVGSSVLSCPQEKSGSLIYRHICLMNHEKTYQTNPMAPWDPLIALVALNAVSVCPSDHLSPPSLKSPLPGSRFNHADLSRTIRSCFFNIRYQVPVGC